MTGVESTLLLQNIGTNFWMINLHILLALVFGALYPLRKSCRPFKWINEKLGRYLHFNGLLRFYMSLFFDIALLSCLNLHIADWNSLFNDVKVSNYLSIAFLTLISSVPPILILFHCKKQNLWRKKEFRSKYGTVLGGTSIRLQKEKKRIVLAIPTMFFLRRILFIVAVLVMGGFVWGQLTLLCYISLTMCFIL